MPPGSEKVREIHATTRAPVFKSLSPQDPENRCAPFPEKYRLRERASGLGTTDEEQKMKPDITRRRFVEFLSAAGIASAFANAGPKKPPAPAPSRIPRWRGFNLLNFFQAFSRGESSDCTIKELDYRWIREWGFDFIRLPMDYWLWIDSNWRKTRKLKPADAFKIKESVLEKVDRAVETARKYGPHVNLNFHRAPGYSINNPGREPFVLWRDRTAEDAFVFHWETFARRYRGISSKDLSFNFLNEAPTPGRDICRVKTTCAS